ncbi:response regulator transcription factor [Flavobacterium sp. MFBS3-15]|uniref:LytR/AlgR family response regulator transcription factor n=1 Tax=Flavobacterium sp. MFBS3-15 TaxID=2989816 RepID=UPI002236A5C3|nr:response regulator transcription factor [Flavobacterium sp. MFBS3-15]MCW4467615.1 response regulator transcription factor [Flavobacterium sp. MFBS3-15]
MINAIAIDDEPLALNAIATLCSATETINLQKTFTSPVKALKYLRKYPADLIFCDIQMPVMDGISLVRSLPYPAMVIFTTAFSDYAALSYELGTIDYLLKPIDERRFSQALHKALEHFNHIGRRDQSSGKSIFIRADFSLMQVPLADILYIEGLADYLKIYIENRRTIVARMAMKEMMEKLDPDEFIRVHRSFILPFKRIEAVKGTVIFGCGRKFPLGKTFVEDFFGRYSL